jgi:hypothetical protein
MDKEELSHLEDLISGFDELVSNLKELDKQAEKNNSEKPIDNKQ